MELYAVALGSWGVVACMLFLVFTPRAARPSAVIRYRIEALGTLEGGGTAAADTAGVWTAGAGDSFWERLAGFFVGERKGSEKDTPLRRLLHQAGYWGDRWFTVLLGIRIALAIALPIATFFLLSLVHVPFLQLVAGLAGAAGLGWGLPLYVIRRKARARQRDIEEAFPDTLDLLVVCVEAGLGTDAALLRVAEEQHGSKLAIGEELLLTCREMRAGLPRREALARMAARLGSESIQSLASFLIRTEELGGSIARSLKIYAETMREKRMHKAQETARKTVIRLLLPLALLIMPALFLVVTAPVVVNVLTFISSTGGVPPPQ